MNTITIELDSVELERLHIVAGINNAEKTAALLISERLAELAEDAMDELIFEDRKLDG